MTKILDSPPAFASAEGRGNDNLVICGALAYDRIMDFPGKFSDHILAGKTHMLNLSFTVNGVKESFGGTGGNIAYNLALLGERPKIVAVAGRDFAKYAVWLKKNKIDISGVKIVKDELTASAYIMTDRADNQLTAFYPGPSASSGRGAKTPLAPPSAYPSGILGTGPGQALARGENAKCNPPNPLCQGGIIAIIAPDLVARMREYAKIFKQFKIPYIFDPGQQITEYNARELKFGLTGAKMLVGNDYEIELILKKLGLKLKQLAKLTEILVITKGRQGSEIYCQGRKIVIPPAKAKAVLDPTGAGDGYRAGFIKGLTMGWPLRKCGRLAGLVAVYTVEKPGTQTHRFSWRELGKRYRDNYGESL